jgi:hypothetical protein
MARQLVELGYRGLGDTIRREDFEARKRLLRERTNKKHAVPKQLASVGRDLAEFPFLQVNIANELYNVQKIKNFNDIRSYLGSG